MFLSNNKKLKHAKYIFESNKIIRLSSVNIKISNTQRNGRQVSPLPQTTKINGRSTSGYGKLAEADFTAYCIIDLTFRQLDSRYRLEILTAVWRHQQAPVSVLLGFYLEKRRRSGQKFQKKSCVITHECFYRISSKIYPRQIKAW